MKKKRKRNFVQACRQKTYRRCYDFLITKLFPGGAFASNTSFWSVSARLFFFLKLKYNWYGFIPACQWRAAFDPLFFFLCVCVQKNRMKPQTAAVCYQLMTVSLRKEKKNVQALPSHSCTCAVIVIHSFLSSALCFAFLWSAPMAHATGRNVLSNRKSPP